MIEFIILEIISITSLLFSILSNVFNFTTLNNYFFLFLWTIIIASIYGINRNNKLYNILSIFFMIPLIFFKGAKPIYFIIILTIFMTIYIVKNVNRGYFNNYIDSFKSSIYFIIGLLIFSYIGGNIYRFSSYSVIFLIIYFITSIILIRNLRHYSIGMDKRLVKRLNRRYLILIGTISAFLAIESIRNLVFNLLNFLYNIFIEVLFLILYYPMAFIFLILEKLANWILSKITSNGQIDMGFIGSDIGEIENIEQIVREFPLLNTAFKTILLLFIIFILYTIFKKYQGKEISSIDYIEQREYISKDMIKIKKQILNKRPTSINEQIRFYYKKYLLRLNKSNVVIEEYYTSEDINDLAEDIFPKSIIKELRRIYMDIRYGDLKGNKDTLEEMKGLYNQLKSKDATGD